MSGARNSSLGLTTVPLLACKPVPRFNATDLASVRAAFQSAARCELQQAWLAAAPASKFSTAVIRVGWQHNVVQVYAELHDTDIFTRATGLNQRMWELGDVLEIFLRPDRQETYHEFHVTPNNQRLQLRIPNTAALRRAQAANQFDSFLLPGEVFQSQVWIEDQPSRWCVFAEIPAFSVCGSSNSLVGSRWHYSFSRYDYTRGVNEPVISSSSPHAEPDFHRQQEWGQLDFKR